MCVRSFTFCHYLLTAFIESCTETSVDIVQTFPQFVDVTQCTHSAVFSLDILSSSHPGSFISVGSGIDAVVALCFPNTCDSIRCIFCAHNNDL